MRHSARRLTRGLLIFIAYYVAGRVGLALATVHSSASPVWPPTGVAVAALLLAGRNYWPVIFLGATLFNVQTSGHLPSSLLIGAGNTLEALAAAWITQRWFNGANAFKRLGTTLGFTAAVLAGTAASATIGPLALAAFGLAPWAELSSIALTWWLGDLGGGLVVAPLIILLREGLPRFGWLELVTLTLLLAATTIVVFGLQLPAVYAVVLLPLLAWPLLRLDARHAAWSVFVVAACMIGLRLAGKGPFHGANVNEDLLLLQIFLAFLSAVMLLQSASVAQRPERVKLRGQLGGVALGLVPLLAALIVVGSILQPTVAREHAITQQAHADLLAAAWEGALHEQGLRLGGIRAMMVAQPSTDRAAFIQYVEDSRWIEQQAGVQAIHFVRSVQDVAAFEAERRGDNQLPPELRAHFTVQPATPVPALVVDYVAPLDGNQASLGRNLAADAALAEPLALAAQRDQPIATAPATLGSAKETQVGFQLLLPVRQGEILVGYVTSLHGVQDLAASLETSQIAYRLYDVTGEPITLHDAAPAASHSTSGDAPLQRDLEAFGRLWRLEVYADATPVAVAGAPWLAMTMGGVLSLGATGMVYAYDSTRERAIRLADEMTRTLRMQQRELHEAQRLAGLGTWRWYPGQRSMLVGKRMQLILGTPPGASIPLKTFLDAIHPADRPTVAAAFGRARTHAQPFDFSCRYRGRKGQEGWLRGLADLATDADGRPMIRGTAQDITRQRLLEEEQRKAREQQQGVQRLQEIDRFRQSFLNLAAHELRTPMTPIRSQLHLLRLRGVTEKGLDILERNFRRLDVLVDDLLKTARIQAGQLGITPREDDLDQLVAEVVESFRADATARGLVLELNGSAKPVVMDAKAITQVLYNLINNALKFTPSGGVKVEVEDSAQAATIHVTDTGRGMTPEGLAHLFKPFSQVHDPMEITEAGSGLGLYISRSLVELHGGSLEAISAGPGKGSRLTLRLPR